MSEAGHHARANRWDDAAAGGQGHGATRRQREEVIAVHLAACRNGKRHVRRPRQSQRWQTEEARAGSTNIVRNRPRGQRALRLGCRPQPPLHGGRPGGWSKPPASTPPHRGRPGRVDRRVAHLPPDSRFRFARTRFLTGTIAAFVAAFTLLPFARASAPAVRAAIEASAFS